MNKNKNKNENKNKNKNENENKSLLNYKMSYPYTEYYALNTTY